MTKRVLLRRLFVIDLTIGLMICLGVLAGVDRSWATPQDTESEARGFETDFTGATLRFDFYQTGTGGEQVLGFDRVRIEGPWPGSRTQRIDSLDYGAYRFQVKDVGSQRLLYSRGFGSIFGEWQSTAEAAAGLRRTLPESVRFPEPRRPVRVHFDKRGSDGEWQEIGVFTIDPTARSVDRTPIEGRVQVDVLLDSGDPATKVDLLVLGDGYRVEERDEFRRQADQVVAALFAVEPYKRRRADFNVRAILAPSRVSGISRPRSGQFVDSPLGTEYNIFDSERYVLTLDDRAWRNVAAAAPYDTVLILFNSDKYGGGGIYNLYATAAAGSGFADYLVVHEFGHSFAALGDEYYTSQVAYQEVSGDFAEPWEPNLTALHDPEALKWRDLVADDTPLPTPWNKQEYEKASIERQKIRQELRAAGAPEAELEDLFRESQALFTEMLASDRYSGRVGAFEGGGYRAQGLYRPSTDCLMFTRDEVGFCAVCTRAIEQVIDLYTR